MLADKIEAIQAALAAADYDGWLFAAFQRNDPISLQMLGIGGEKLVTRRCYYLIPRSGKPRKLVHDLEPEMLHHLPGESARYITWREHRAGLMGLVAGMRRLACQYSPQAALPSVSRLDAGTAEILREGGSELVSSAELVQLFAATWSEEQLASHRRANVHLHRIVKTAFQHVRETLLAGRSIDEYAVQCFILEQFAAVGLHGEGAPIVGVDAHAADPHYQPGSAGSSPIVPGNFLLIDLWAKELDPKSIYADITWCGVVAPAPTERHQEIFDLVAGARDAAAALVLDRFPARPIRGFEVDDAARGVITRAGYGDRFGHRTGHSIDTSDHGQGANMDNLETHDTRLLVPMTGFSIEPGIYLPGEFGVRSEINVALLPDRAEITGGEPQRELIRVLA